VLWSKEALNSHVASCEKVSQDMTHRQVVGFPPPRHLLETPVTERFATAYYCPCGAAFFSFHACYLHLFLCETWQPPLHDEAPMISYRALVATIERRFRLHPLVIVQVCSSCFKYRTVDNWSLDRHWAWCVKEKRRLNAERVLSDLSEERDELLQLVRNVEYERREGQRQADLNSLRQLGAPEAPPMIEPEADDSPEAEDVYVVAQPVDWNARNIWNDDEENSLL